MNAVQRREVILERLSNADAPVSASVMAAELGVSRQIVVGDVVPALYTEIGERFAALDAWSMYLITSYEDAEKYIGRKADKNRKIYNGMLKTYFYQFMGPRPPKRSQENRNVD